MLPIKDTIPSKTTAYVTWMIILINIGVFYYQLKLSSSSYANMVNQFAFIPRDMNKILESDPMGIVYYYPIITSLFLHGGWMHIISNLWVLWIFGDNVEDRMGHFNFLLFYLLSGIIANLTQFSLDPTSIVPTIGASGAIASIMGAYMILFPMSRILTLVPIIIIPWFFRIPAFIFLLIWFLMQIYSGTSSIGNGVAGGVAWWAHIGGFVFGMLFFRFFLNRNYKEA